MDVEFPPNSITVHSPVQQKIPRHRSYPQSLVPEQWPYRSELVPRAPGLEAVGAHCSAALSFARSRYLALHRPIAPMVQGP